MNDVEDKDAEIDRLNAEVEMMTEQAIKFRDMARDHAALLARAADAMACCNLTMQEQYDLIAELRKAAQ